MGARELGKPLGNPLARKRAEGRVSAAPDLVLRRSFGPDVIVIPDGYKTRRVTLIAPGGYGSDGGAGKGGDSGQGGGAAQTYREAISEKQVSFTIGYAAASTCTATIDGIVLTASRGVATGQALASPPTITAGRGIAVAGNAVNIGATGVSAAATANGAPSALPGITGYEAGGGGAGGGGYGTFYGLGGVGAEGALTANAATGTASTARGSGRDIILESTRSGSPGAVIVELWK